MRYRHIDVITGEVHETSNFEQLYSWFSEMRVALVQMKSDLPVKHQENTSADVHTVSEWQDISNACERFSNLHCFQQNRLLRQIQKSREIEKGD